MRSADQVDELLKARAEIDEQLRRHKNALTVLFTDVVGSTRFFERNGDTAGLVMIHRHDELAARAIKRHAGTVIKTIGDSAMAEFPDPASAVHAAIEIERQFLKLNLTLPPEQRVEVRIGVHTGVGFRKGKDLFGDVVNVTARIVKRTAPAQILISRAMYEAVADVPELNCRWINKVTIDGRTEKEDIFEVVWGSPDTQRDLPERPAVSSQIPARYQALGQIGTGGTGIVYKACDLETGEIVALKILKPEIASDPEVQENLKRELCLARKITHKNVCRIHEFSRSNGMAYTSMEFVEGESLSARLFRGGSMPLIEAVDIARQISAGLREAHAQGIVHRDLKPANIMLDRNGTVKIMDFGIARMIQREGPMTGTIVGTPAYMAPEQAELKPVSSCTDIYAMGLVLYEMITGIPAFAGDSPIAVAVKQIRDYPKRPREIVPQLSRAMEAVIMKCLQKDPARRFQSIAEFEIALAKGARARPATSWESAADRFLVRAESEARNVLRQVAEKAEVFFEREDRRVHIAVHEDPKAMLGVSGIVAACMVFLLFGAWKPRTANAQPSGAASRNFVSPIATASVPGSDFKALPQQTGLVPISMGEVDLYGDSRSGNAQPSSTEQALPSDRHASQLAPPPVASPKPARTAKPVKSRSIPDAKNSHPAAQASAQIQIVASPVAVANPESATATTSMAPESAGISARTDGVPNPSAEPTKTAAPANANGGDIKEPKLFIEVGTFKDETWANNAVDQLTQLGFHVVMIHKTLLWSQSYHVEVGPYATQEDVAAARLNLGSHGIKVHK